MGGVCIGLESDRAGSRSPQKTSRRDRSEFVRNSKGRVDFELRTCIRKKRHAEPEVSAAIQASIQRSLVPPTALAAILAFLSLQCVLCPSSMYSVSCNVSHYFFVHFVNIYIYCARGPTGLLRFFFTGYYTIVQYVIPTLKVRLLSIQVNTFEKRQCIAHI